MENENSNDGESNTIPPEVSGFVLDFEELRFDLDLTIDFQLDQSNLVESIDTMNEGTLPQVEEVPKTPILNVSMEDEMIHLPQRRIRVRKQSLTPKDDAGIVIQSNTKTTKRPGRRCLHLMDPDDPAHSPQLRNKIIKAKRMKEFHAENKRKYDKVKNELNEYVFKLKQLEEENEYLKTRIILLEEITKDIPINDE